MPLGKEKDNGNQKAATAGTTTFDIVALFDKALDDSIVFLLRICPLGYFVLAFYRTSQLW